MGHIKIISDGTGRGTRIIDSETGKDIPGAYAFEVSGKSNRAVVSATIHCCKVELDVASGEWKLLRARRSLLRRLRDWWRAKRMRVVIAAGADTRKG